MPPNTKKNCSERSSLLVPSSTLSPHSASSSSSSSLIDEEQGPVRNRRLALSSSSSRDRNNSRSPNIQLSFVRQEKNHQDVSRQNKQLNDDDDDVTAKPPTNRQSRCLLVVLAALMVPVAISAAWYGVQLYEQQKHKQRPPRTFQPDDEHYAGPFSTLDPVHDLGLTDYDRPASSKPSKRILATTTTATSTTTTTTAALPTNAWYQNLLLVSNDDDDDNDPSNTIHRAYTTPYIVDAAGPVPGIRLHFNHLESTTTVVQVGLIESFGLTVGATTTDAVFASTGRTGHSETSGHSPFQYHVQRTTPLGITLEWKNYSMTSSIVRGMPYATMVYHDYYQNNHKNDRDAIVLPTIASEIELASPPIVDGTIEMKCDHVENNNNNNNNNDGQSNNLRQVVQREVQLTFKASDFTWIVFTSQPVVMQCRQQANGSVFLQVVDTDGVLEGEDDDDHDSNKRQRHNNQNSPLVLRIALLEPCTHGNDPVYCHIDQELRPHGLYLGQGKYPELLRQHADAFPGPNTSFSYRVDELTGSIQMTMDWNVQYMSDTSYPSFDADEGDEKLDVANNKTTVIPTDHSDLITFALPHHFDMLPQNQAEFYYPDNSNNELYCATSLLGPACLIQGSTWTLIDKVPLTDFRAPRSMEPQFLWSISNSLQQDLKYTLPDFYRRGSADTYFSGKMLARLARITLIAEEVIDTCRLEGLRGITQEDYAHYSRACQRIWIPSDDDLMETVEELKQSVQVWIDGTGETPFVYDSAWGGVVSCGCTFDGKKCKTKFPECPAFTDPGLNFGNAYYNDMHFHYGYHIFAAAVVAHFDPVWGRQYFERVLLLVRNIANPTEDDKFFTPWRHKDWFQGHSWASGIAGRYLNGRNQESSSEAIAAYEGVFLYGEAMEPAWLEVGETHQASIARAIKHTGQVMAASEVRSARRYWHVSQDDDNNKIFPLTYKPRVVGIMWQTMAQFQTWFGNAPYLAYGIQLLPLTPISEERDGLKWARSMYTDFAASCESEKDCKKSGWRILQLAMEATVGHKQLAFDKSLEINASVFEDPGGNGHSLSNTLWYIATRPRVSDPLPLTDHTETPASGDEDVKTKSKLDHCGRPSSCTDYVLNTIADIYTCRQRMEWLMKNNGKTAVEACISIAAHEYPRQCGMCNPLLSEDENTPTSRPHCPPCNQDVCQSELNRCPRYETTYVCTEGQNHGGCSSAPWDMNDQTCSSCCELTHCQKLSPPATTHAQTKPVDEESCPPCTREFCQQTKVLCPLGGTAPFFCMKGPSRGGCSPYPWVVTDGDCEKCCTVTNELCG